MKISQLFNKKRQSQNTDISDSLEQNHHKPDNYDKGVEHFNAGRYTQAMEYFQAMIANEPKHENSYIKLALSYIKGGKEEQAKKTLLDLLNINPNNQEALNLLRITSSSSSNPAQTEKTNIKTNQFDGALTGIFSVSLERKVNFSRGNLQYRAKSNSYRFAENQYDIIGEDNSYISQNNEKYIDLFCWGSSGYKSLYPYIGDTGDIFKYDCDRKDITSTKYDWGVNNAIENGGNVSGVWRTLTKEEWEYLLHGRNNARRLYAFGSIAGVCGLLLMPDYYVNTDIVIDSEDFSANTLTSKQWLQLEMKGVVFLPCAGHRGSGSNLYHINISGQYWSTSFANPWAYFFCVENKFITVSSVDCTSGLSVRLVKNV